MEAETIPGLPFHWLYLPTLLRLGLATGSGIFVGLEREHNGKAGARTFAFAALLGCLGGLMSQSFAMLSIGVVTVLVIFMNGRQMLRDNSLALTTSLALRRRQRFRQPAMPRARASPRRVPWR